MNDTETKLLKEKLEGLVSMHYRLSYRVQAMDEKLADLPEVCRRLDDLHRRFKYLETRIVEAEELHKSAKAATKSKRYVQIPKRYVDRLMAVRELYGNSTDERDLESLFTAVEDLLGACVK